MAADPEVQALGEVLGRHPVPKAALTTLVRSLAGAHLLALVDGYVEGGPRRLAVVGVTSDRLVIAVNRKDSDRLYDFALTELDDCGVVGGFGPGDSSLLLVPADNAAPLIVMDTNEHRAERLCAVAGPPIREARVARAAGHWSTSIPADFCLRYQGRLLTTPHSSAAKPTRIAATLTDAGVALRRPEGGPQTYTFIRWSQAITVTVDGVDQLRNRPSVAAVVFFGVLGLAARRKEAESYLVIETSEGPCVIEVKDTVPAKLRADLSPLLRALPNDTENSVDPSPAAGEEDVLSTIRRLGELRDEGLLTVEEFNDKKAELLRRL